MARTGTCPIRRGSCAAWAAGAVDPLSCASGRSPPPWPTPLSSSSQRAPQPPGEACACVAMSPCWSTLGGRPVVGWLVADQHGRARSGRDRRCYVRDHVGGSSARGALRLAGDRAIRTVAPMSLPSGSSMSTSASGSAPALAQHASVPCATTPLHLRVSNTEMNQS